MNNRVLLTNGLQRKTLAVARTLGVKGIEVISADIIRLTPTSFSKFTTKSLVYPDPRKYPMEFLDWLIVTLQNNSYDALFPMDDDTQEIVLRNREQLEKLCLIPLPPSESYRIAADKALSLKLAEQCCIKCPQTFVPKDLEELTQLPAGLNFPVIIKPRNSSGSRGIRAVKNYAELIQQYKAIHQKYPFPLIQEYITSGPRYDVCLLINQEQDLRACFVQKELRHFPLKMGPSTAQESVLFPELVEMSLTLLNRLKWSGIIELEYMLDGKTGEPVFMEINPRFWGSLQTAILSGVDFPWLLYRMIRDGDVNRVVGYHVGQKCRWLLPGDLLHFLANPHRFKMDPPFLSKEYLKIHDDIISRRDPKPTLGFLLACFSLLFNLEMWKMMFKR